MDDATDLFASTAGYYARYRPGYPAAALDRIRAAFGLDGAGRLLDLGCGTGELARALHGDFTEVVGLDVSAEMLAEARRQATQAGITNIRWYHLPAEEISDALGRFRLVAIGNAFHWMRREVVLDRAYDLLEPGGGIAILGNPGVWTGEDAWERAAHDVIVRWLGARRRTRAGFFADEEGAEKIALARSRFVDLEAGEHRWSRPVDVDTILGGFFSTSFASRALLGDRADDFAADLRRALLALDPAGHFVQHLITDYLFAHKR